MYSMLCSCWMQVRLTCFDVLCNDWLRVLPILKKKLIFLKNLLADKVVLVNPFWWICLLFKVLFNRYSSRLCTARLIDGQHQLRTSSTNIIQCVAKWYVRKIIITVQWFQIKSQPQGETRQASFLTGTVRPQVGIFLSPLNTTMDFIYLTYPYQPMRKMKSEHPHVGHTLVAR